MGAIGKLHLDGDHLCTAFLIRSEEVFVTGRYGREEPAYVNTGVSAGHCYSQNITFESRAMRMWGAYWYPRQFIASWVIGMSRGDEGYDLMVFKFWSLWKLPVLKIAWNYTPSVGENLSTVGYGNRVLNVVTGPFLGYSQDKYSEGELEIGMFINPGQSGAPVFNHEGKVVGVIRAHKLKAPRTRIEIMFGLYERDKVVYAVPIDRLRGLVKVN
jgi:hypothetical protein